MEELSCKNCGASIHEEHISSKLSLARCGHCDAVFTLPASFADSTLARDHGAPRYAPGSRPKVELPQRFKMEDRGHQLEISYSWFTPAIYFLVFFCVIWNGFMLFWHSVAIASGQWIMSAFGLLHTAVGIGLMYACLVTLFNRTTIRAERGELSIRHGPLPCLRSTTLDVKSLKQIYCKEVEHRGKRGSVSHSYAVWVVKQNNVRDSLLKGFHDSQQALFIEQELERFLKIPDEAVPGELKF